MKGEILALISAILWGIAPVIDRYALSNGAPIYTALTVRAVGALLAMIFIVFALRTSFSIRLDLTILLLIAGAIGGAIAMIFYYMALDVLGASRTVPITAIYPMFTALFSILLLSEPLTPKMVVGIAFIILGVVIVSEV
ncbi:MAG: bacterial/archaeal transporter family protein [Archaeoglobaceae archaeon]|nr:bacterial/archaeal transporter family protein [Archaeoglobaceae archaeon]MDK2875870.1 bacterial/archaeal transporter family protein [Archaeoglobaceae archaeon]